MESPTDEHHNGSGHCAGKTESGGIEITAADWLAERELLRQEITDYILAGEEPPASLWENLYRVAIYVERTAQGEQP